jgi:MipA family protein
VSADHPTRLLDVGALWRAFSATAPALLPIVLAIFGAATGARAEQLPLWEAGAGVTVISLPDYRGSDERRTWLLPFPYLVYRGEFLQADERRMRGLFFKTESIELDASVSGTPPVKSSENEARQGMPDLDPTLEIGPSLNFSMWKSADRKTTLELRLPARAVFASDLSYVDFVGWVFQPTLNVDTRDVLGYPGWKLGLLGGPVYSNGHYNRYFYAVDPAFATASRPAYSPGGGYGGAQFIAALSKRYGDFWIGGFAKWDTLNEAVFADSPLVTARQTFSAGIAVAWMIGESKTRVETNTDH